MKLEEHKKIHLKLHGMLDELCADYITHTRKRLSNSTIMDLMNWSFLQTKNPTQS